MFAVSVTLSFGLCVVLGLRGSSFIVTILSANPKLDALTGKKVGVPEPLRQQYPELERIADEPPQEPTLFSS
jgi:hypothetical protein